MHRVYAIRAISDLTDITFVQMKDGQVLRDEKGETKEILRRLNTTKVRELEDKLPQIRKENDAKYAMKAAEEKKDIL